MSEDHIPQNISELLQPVNTGSPTGEDVARSDDPVASSAYTDLEMEISKVGEVNYQKTAQMAADIIVKYSKHLRVASWLCLSWFRLQGPEGLKDGLLLILQLLKKYSGQLYPEKAAHRSKALQFISTDKRFFTLEKSDITDRDMISQIQELLNEIKSQCDTYLPENKPDLSRLSEIVENRLETFSTGADEKPLSDSDERQEELESIQKPDSQSTEHREEPVIQPEVKEVNKEKAEEAPGAEDIERADEVVQLLEDISSDKPVGDNIEETENQDVQALYMTLESEITKYSGNDYQKCFKLANELLQTHGKHLRVAVWLLIVWFHIENLDGFKKGIQLLLDLINKYGTNLYPPDAKQKSRILQMLNSEPRLKIYEKVKVDQHNAPIIRDTGILFQSLVEQSRNLLPDVPPKLTAIHDIIVDKIAEARDVLEGGKKEPPPPVVQEKPAVPKTPSVTQAPSTPPPTTGTSTSGAGGINISDDKSAKIAIKKALQFYFQDDASDPAKKNISSDPMVYSISRAMRWTKMKLPPDTDNVTQVEGPNEPKQNYILKLYSNKEWDKLIPELETNFISNDSFTFWLDAQRILIEAMLQKGEAFENAVEEIKMRIALLVSKYPAITKLVFKDMKTPFADKTTIDWIQGDVMGSLTGGKIQEKILPPIMGEEYDQINKDYEAACEQLPKNFEENLRRMQQSIEGESRKKGRFLRLLNLANYCYLAKKYLLAQPFFKQLMQLIEEYHISEWETALCVAVWQSSFLNNNKLMDNEKDKQKKAEINQEQKILFEKIVKYDAVLALTLENHIHK